MEVANQCGTCCCKEGFWGEMRHGEGVVESEGVT